jgi:hypothetical protein
MTDETNVQAGKSPSQGWKGRLLPLAIVAVLMAAEGVGVFLLAKAISPQPVATLAAGLESADDQGEGVDSDRLAEVELAECRPSNKASGKFVTFHIRVTALVAAEDEEKVKNLVRLKQARLEDGVNTVIRSAEPKHFNEPTLDTIKRRLKHEFDRIFGDDQLIKEVLIPQLLQSGPGV